MFTLEKSCIASILVKVLPSLNCVDNIINNLKDSSDIVLGSQTSQNIVKISKQASIYNFYT